MSTYVDPIMSITPQTFGAGQPSFVDVKQVEFAIGDRVRDKRYERSGVVVNTDIDGDQRYLYQTVLYDGDNQPTEVQGLDLDISREDERPIQTQLTQQSDDVQLSGAASILCGYKQEKPFASHSVTRIFRLGSCMSRSGSRTSRSRSMGQRLKSQVSQVSGLDLGQIAMIAAESEERQLQFGK